MKSKALAAATAVLLSTAIGVTFAAPSYAGTTLHSQAKTATSPAAAAGSTPANAGPLCEGLGSRPGEPEPDPCSVAPYTTHNFQNAYTTSYWGMPPTRTRTRRAALLRITGFSPDSITEISHL